MALSYDSTGGNKSDSNTTSLTWTHTSVQAPNIAYVSGIQPDATSVADGTATFGGTSMTQILKIGATGAFGLATWIYRLVNPPSGAQTVIINFPATGKAAAISHAWVGADLAALEIGMTSGQGANLGELTVAGVPTGGAAMNFWGAYNNNAAGLGAGDTQINKQISSWTYQTTCYAGYQMGSGSVATGWTAGDTVTNRCAWGLGPRLGGGDQVIWIAFRRWQNFLRDLRLGLVPPDQLRRTYRELVQI